MLHLVGVRKTKPRHKSKISIRNKIFSLTKKLNKKLNTFSI